MDFTYYLNKLKIAFYGSHTQRIISECIDFLVLLWPYLVTGIIITALVRVFLSKDRLTLLFQNHKKWAFLLAALLGVVSPLGTYVVIPLTGALFLSGTPMPVLMAFLVSSPLINPNLFILTAGAFGYEMAFMRVLTAIILGLLAGVFTQWFLNKGWLHNESLIKEAYIIDKKLNVQNQNIIISRLSFLQFSKIFGIELWKMTKYISKYFFLAIFIAALMKILIPIEWIEVSVGSGTFMSVLIATGAGIPFYSCGGAAIPVVQALADMGMSKGAILAFFISGPATGISNLIIFKTAFNARLLYIYLFINIIGALFFGLVYNLY